MGYHWRGRAMDHHWRLHTWSRNRSHWTEETYWKPGAWSCHRAYQAGETYWRLGSGRRHRTHQAGLGFFLGVGTGYTGPWRRTGGLKRRAGTTLPGWMVTFARQMRGNGTGRTELWPLQRHSVQSRRRISWSEETHWRPGALSQHHPSWLDAHSSPPNAGCWNVSHRAVHAHWRHRALYHITWCLTNTTLLAVSKGS